MEVRPLKVTHRWNGRVFVTARLVALALAAVIGAAAATGFVATARRTHPSRRHRALARIRTHGPIRAHRLPAAEQYGRVRANLGERSSQPALRDAR
jgi:hypothetical protein